MYCRECGKPLLESDKFCSNCGTPVKKIVPTDEPMFKTEGGDRPIRTKTAPLPSFTAPEPAEEPKGERMIFEAIGDSIKWDTDIFPDKTKAPKKTEDVDFHWNLSEDEFRNRPVAAPRSNARREPSLWSGADTPADTEKKSTGLKPSDTNSWEELFEGTRADEKNTRQAPGVGRSSIEAYWEDMFRRDGAVQRESHELPERRAHRTSISRDDIHRGIGDEGSERLDQNKLEDTMTLSRREMEGAIREEREEKTETRENREVAELASLAAAGIGAGPTFVPEGVDAVTLPEDKEAIKPAAEEEPAITGEELEKELFAEMEEPMTEAQKMRARQTEKIDKFYTFNKKNEEFQKLLDQEYERFKASREEDDFAEDLYKLGDENFFEDYSREGNSQAEEMAKARQTLFHTDEFAALKDLQKEAAAEEAAEEPAVQAEESPAEESPIPTEPAAEEAPEEPAAEEPAEEPAPRREKKKKSFLGKLFGKDDDDEAEEAAVTAAAAAAGLAGVTAEEAAAEEEAPAEEAEAPAAEVVSEAEEKAEETPEAPAEEAAPAEEEEPETASIVFEPEQDEPVVNTEPAESAEEAAAEEAPAEAPAEPAAETAAEPEEETAPAEEPADGKEEADSADEAPAAESGAGEAESAEEPEEDIDMTKTASIVFEPEQDEPVVNTEPDEPSEEAAAEEDAAAEQLPRTTEPTRVYEKGDIPSPTTEEERASQFEESRAEAWDAFFSDDEDVNAGNTFDAEIDERPYEEDGEKRGGNIAVSILAVILVFLLALIVIRLAMPDSIISIKLDQITEKILHLFNSGLAGSLLQHIM